MQKQEVGQKSFFHLNSAVTTRIKSWVEKFAIRKFYPSSSFLPSLLTLFQQGASCEAFQSSMVCGKFGFLSILED